MNVYKNLFKSSRRTAVKSVREASFGIEKDGFGSSLIGFAGNRACKASLLRSVSYIITVIDFISFRPRKVLKKRTTNYNRSIDHACQRRLSKMWLRQQEVTNRGDSFFTLGDDNEYRHENRHLMAALRSDDLAAGPFLSFLIDDFDDEGMYAIYYWQEVEKFRESFSGMQQHDKQDAFDEILKRVRLSVQFKLRSLTYTILVCPERAWICKSPGDQRIRKRNI